MTEKLRQKFSLLFVKQPLYIKIIIILTISIFLPLFITIPVIIASFVFFLCNKASRKAILDTPYVTLLALMSVLLLATPLVFKNYYGFACGILLIIFFVFEISINYVMTEKLFRLLCDICCAMSVICFAVAVIEKAFNLQIRVEAFTYNANFYGYIVELVILNCFYGFIRTKKPIYLLIAAVNVSAVFLADCRSAWSGLLAGLIVLFAILKMRKSLITLLSISVTVVTVVYLNPSLFPRHNDIGSTTLNRFHIWNQAFNDFIHHPVFGRGLLAMYQVSHNIVTPHAHNLLLDLLECTGIVGTAVIIFFFVIIIRQLSASFRLGDRNTKRCVAICWSIIAATLAHGITDMPVMGVHTGLFFFLILAMRPKLVTTAGAEIDETEGFSNSGEIK